MTNVKRKVSKVEVNVVERSEETELLEALRACLASLLRYIPKESQGYADGCFKYIMGGTDMWNCTCSVCKARRAIAKATTHGG